MIWRRVVALLVFSWSFLLPAGWSEKRCGVIVALGAWAVSTGLAIWVGWRIGPEIFSDESFGNLGLILSFSLIMLLSSVPASSVLQVKNSQSLFTLPGVRHGCFIFYFLGFLGYVTWAYLTLGGLLAGRYGTLTIGYLSHPVTQTLFFILLLISIQCLHSSRLSIRLCLLCGLIGVVEAPRIGSLDNDQLKLLVELSFIGIPIIFLLFEGRRTAHSISLDGHRIVIDRSSYLKDRATGDKISSLQQPNRVQEVIANSWRSIIDRYEGKFLEDFRSRGLIGYLLVRDTLFHVMTMGLVCLLLGTISSMAGGGIPSTGLLALHLFCVSIFLFVMFPRSPLLRVSRKAYTQAFIIKPALQALVSGVLVTLLVCLVEPQLISRFFILLQWTFLAILNCQLSVNVMYGRIITRKMKWFNLFLLYGGFSIGFESIADPVYNEFSASSLVLPSIILLFTAIRIKLLSSTISRGDLNFES